MKMQKDEILSFVESERQRGRALSEILSHLKLSRSTYYRWINKGRLLKDNKSDEKKSSIRTVTDEELKKVDKMKEKYPEMRHRQIQGMLQGEGSYLSATTVYKRLKANNSVEPYARRPSPWDEPLYEPIRANVMWGADWTQLRIAGKRWYLLNLIDFYSRYVVHFEIVPTVNARNVKNLYESGLSKLNIPLRWENKPELRLDQGSPNTSRVTKEFFKDIGADLSFARVRRPTDNARTERFYRTIKQEEIYVVGDYQDEQTAREVLREYIAWYNEKRPHQALWNFTPYLVHETNNKTYLLEKLREMKQRTWTERKEYWMEQRVKAK